MSDPAIMICVGATKAGTSSLYSYLHDHPDCHIRSVKELHYFDTIEFDNFTFQFDDLARLRADLEKRRAEAQENDDPWRVANLVRRMLDVDELTQILSKGEEGLNDYLFYLVDGVGDRKLVADLTPAYGLLPEERLKQMATMAPDVRFVFLMRDPVDRLWSHVRMRAQRGLKDGEDFAEKADRVLDRLVTKNRPNQIIPRGDYATIVEKLKRSVPEEKRLIGFTEELMTTDGLATICEFLGISEKTVEEEPRTHEGVKLKLSDAQRQKAAQYLAPQYAYVEKTFGRLPERWQANMARI
ncbi:sulfotransferase [Celeribacter litoreus]|uniref:sulfotransferase n=1 Tax=Celeribacter litoreus TaxID=2876714 RepID=UPI001CCF590F|nr:sulfotransferase [Celeribacter litoreus]MCA0045259.1 sulfotransferase [Celeribacter litoreus]